MIQVQLAQIMPKTFIVAQPQLIHRCFCTCFGIFQNFTKQAHLFLKVTDIINQLNKGWPAKSKGFLYADFKGLFFIDFQNLQSYQCQFQQGTPWYSMQEKYINNVFEEKNYEARREQDDLNEQANSGHWTHQENLLYIYFLDLHKLKFSCRLKRKKIRLFEKMADFIGSRSAVQCRTHHQKYESKFGNTKMIIRSYKQAVGIDRYRSYVKKMKENSQTDKVENVVHELFQILHVPQTSTKSREIGVQTQQEDFKFLNSLMAPFKAHQSCDQLMFWVPIRYDIF